MRTAATFVLIRYVGFLPMYVVCLCYANFYLAATIDVLVNLYTVYPRNLAMVRFYFKAPFGAVTIQR